MSEQTTRADLAQAAAVHGPEEQRWPAWTVRIKRPNCHTSHVFLGPGAESLAWPQWRAEISRMQALPGLRTVTIETGGRVKRTAHRGAVETPDEPAEVPPRVAQFTAFDPTDPTLGGWSPKD